MGKILKISVFGQSHGKAIGVSLGGLPAGEKIDLEELMLFLDRRRPGKNNLSTKRSEADKPVFLSGIINGFTCGSPICAIIENGDTKSSDYDELLDKPRPSHADYTAHVKWGGRADMRGGGHFSGRLTAPLCIAGGIAKQILFRRGIYIGAHLLSAGGERDVSFPLLPTAEMFTEIAQKPFPVIDDTCGEKMQKAITDAAAEKDSVGGVIECAAIGVPAGIGSPMFGGVENRLSAAIFGIPAVKGVEFGSGFAGADLKGSQNNDPFTIDSGGKITLESNNSGGILGGITSGMPVLLRVAVKPTPSIGKTQQTVSLSRMEKAQLEISGRHDPCIAHRAVPVVEAVTAAVILDMLLEESKDGTF